MKRSEAERLVKRASLPAAEKAILYALLCGADNADCALQPFTTPSNTEELAQWAGLSRAQLYRVLPHLERHGWLKRETWRGRGKKTAYKLFPRQPETCTGTCPEKVASRDVATKAKGRTTRQSTSHHATQNVSPVPTSPQVEPAFARRDAGEGEGVCRRCSQPKPLWVLNPRDGHCITCFQTIRLESA